jgi:hypothetical protein
MKRISYRKPCLLTLNERAIGQVQPEGYVWLARPSPRIRTAAVLPDTAGQATHTGASAAIRQTGHRMISALAGISHRQDIIVQAILRYNWQVKRLHENYQALRVPRNPILSATNDKKS